MLIAYAINKKPVSIHNMYPNPNSQSTYTVTMRLKFSKQMLVACHLLKQVSFIVFTDVPRDEGSNL